jgi:hypothetical protein
MYNYLKYIDLFPRQISLIHKGRLQFRNSFSTLVSFFIIIGMILSTIFFGRNFFERLNPQVIFKSSPTGNFPYLEQNNTNFFAAAALTDFSRNPLAFDESYFSILFRFTEHLIVDGKDIWNVSFFNTTLCNQLNISNKFYNELNNKTKILDGYLCPIITPFTLGGDASQFKESWVDILVKDCVNSTSQIVCKSKSQIKNFFYDKHFILNTLDNFAIVDDYSAPLKEKRIYFSKYISYQFYQGIELLYENLTVTTDAGLVFKSINQDSTLSLKKEINNLSIYPEQTPWARTLVQYTFKITNSLTEHKRNYMKAQELSAFIGGIFSVYLIIGRCVVFVFTNNFFYQDLAESFYSCEEDNLLNKYLRAECDSKSIFPRTNNLLFPDKTKLKEIKISAIEDIKKGGLDIISKTIDINKNQDFKYGKRLNLCDIICFSFNCKRDNENYRIFSLIKDEIEKSLEVSKKIKLYKEFGLLSAYVLNKNELTAFNYQNYSLIKSSYENEKLNMIQLDEMIEFYKEKYKSKMLNEKEQMLMNNLKKNIQSKILNI